MSTERETRSCARFRPHPQPLSRREKGLGDEGARYLYNAHPISLLA
ncbi:hypothetical protein FDUTEX481_01313 [Tolypothrix sp. PCC 7601]|nr:hypothetical protein FDUTEX481_01313 [Tolypothrix sp. PCC 7601]